MHPNVVAEYEVLEACVFSNYNWEYFSQLAPEKQAYCIAHFRTHNRIESIVQQEISEHTKHQRPK